MATYFVSDFNTGTPPSGWTKRWNTSVTWTGANPLQIPLGVTNDWCGLTLDSVDSDADRDDIELLIKFRTLSTVGTQRFAVVRGSGADETPTHLHITVTASQLSVGYCAGSDTRTSIQAVSVTHNTSTTYWLRARFIGSAIQARTWADGGGEPGTWQVDTTDSNVLAAGWAGVCTHVNASAQTISQFGVGTNGDTAPATGSASLDLAGSRTASLTGTVTATGDLQYAINLAGAKTASLSGALTVSGDIQITPAPTLDLAGSQTAALAGVLAATGDLQYTRPVDLAASAAAALSGSLSISGDLEYSTDVFLDLVASPIALTATFSAAGDLDPYPSLDLTGSQTTSLSGSVTVTGDLNYTTPFELTQTANAVLFGVVSLSGDLEYSTAPAPPPISPGWGGGAVGGGGKGLRELTARIAKDAEDLLERKRKAHHEPAPESPQRQTPARVAEAGPVARTASRTDRDEGQPAKPAVPGPREQELLDLRALQRRVEKLEEMILEDRRRREEEAEEEAVVKLLLG